jgi:hypothetical protein
MNNVFSDKGTGAALVRPLPRLVNLSRATRESVMDLEPWSYVVMAHELHAERKIRPDGGLDMNTIDDPRRYVYVEALLELHGAAAVAHARGVDGVWRASHFGIPELRFERNGWVRVAVPTGEAVTVCQRAGAGRVASDRHRSAMSLPRSEQRPRRGCCRSRPHRRCL